jgi:hypothetical protein
MRIQDWIALQNRAKIGEAFMEQRIPILFRHAARVDELHAEDVYSNLFLVVHFISV